MSPVRAVEHHDSWSSRYPVPRFGSVAHVGMRSRVVEDHRGDGLGESDIGNRTPTSPASSVPGSPALPGKCPPRDCPGLPWQRRSPGLPWRQTAADAFRTGRADDQEKLVVDVEKAENRSALRSS